MIRSNGAVTVLAVAPATPPATNILYKKSDRGCGEDEAHASDPSGKPERRALDICALAPEALTDLDESHTEALGFAWPSRAID